MKTEFILSQALVKTIGLAQQKARENIQPTYSGSHLLWAVLKDEEEVNTFLQQTGKELFKLLHWAEFRISHYPKANRGVESPPADALGQAAFKEADKIRARKFEPEVGCLHLLQAICTPEVAFTAEQLARFPIGMGDFEDFQSQYKSALDTLQTQRNQKAPKRNTQALEKYCSDITNLARQGKIDPVIGRDLELKKLMEVLGKRLSPNVLLIGEPGVGKTAVVGGLALNILSGKVPSPLKEASIFELDVNGSLVAGAFKGEVEQRLKEVLRSIKEFGNKAILFIDEIHCLLDEQGAVGSGAVNLLKPELARGELTIIGATTQAEYRKYMESDEAFGRRFTLLHIQEPSTHLAMEMLRGIMPSFEQHHHLTLSVGVVEEAVLLAKRFLPAKNLPVSAIEVMDHTMSSIQVMNDTSLMELEQLEQEWQEIEKEIKVKNKGPLIASFEERAKSRLSHLLFSRLEEVKEGKERNWEEDIKTLKEWSMIKKETVEKEDVAAMVAYLSGIPMGKIQRAEKEKLQHLEEVFRKRVVGQDPALVCVSDALRRARAGIREANKPSAVFFFLGPTGTGKTELAKAIAEALYLEENALIRFDMSEFKEEHSVALLYGSPPGYVGYKEGGLLVNKIRQNPYSVVLFDEIEKAHPSVYDLFLQILDEGKVHDKLDREGDFTHAVVIFTSNVKATEIAAVFEQGIIPSEEFLKDCILATGKFRPELLGRSMDIIPFAPIPEKVASAILDIHLDHFIRLLARQGIELEVSVSAKQELVRSGFSPLFGARPLKESIRRRLGNVLSNKIISEEIKKGDKVIVDWNSIAGEFQWDIYPALLENELVLF
jgi:ATP-dependent Clp protease ATP-binding subunit ClpA